MIYKLCRSPGRGGGGYIPPSGTGTFHGRPGGGSQARYPVPWELVSSRQRWRVNMGGGILTRTGRDTFLNGIGGGPLRLLTGDGSH